MTLKTLDINNLYEKNIIGKVTRDYTEQDKIYLYEIKNDGEYHILNKNLNMNLYPEYLSLSSVNLSKYFFRLKVGGSTYIQKIAHRVSLFDRSLIGNIFMSNNVYLSNVKVNRQDLNKTFYEFEHIAVDGPDNSKSLTNDQKHLNLFHLSSKMAERSVLFFNKDRKVFINDWLNEYESYGSQFYFDKDNKYYYHLPNTLIKSIFPNINFFYYKQMSESAFKFRKIFPKSDFYGIEVRDNIFRYKKIIEDMQNFYLTDEQNVYNNYQILNMSYYINIHQASLHKVNEPKTQNLFTSEILKEAQTQKAHAILATPFARTDIDSQKVWSGVLYLNEENFLSLVKISHVVSCMVGRPLSPVYNYLITSVNHEKI
jgi:hypothetical protein